MARGNPLVEIGRPYTTGEGQMLPDEGDVPPLVEVGRPYFAEPEVEIGRPEFGSSRPMMAKAKRREPGPEYREMPMTGQGPRAMPTGPAARRVQPSQPPPAAQPWWQDEKQADAAVASLLSKLETAEATGAMQAGPGVLPWTALPEDFRTKAAGAVQGSPIGWRGLNKLDPRERELLTRLVIAGERERKAREEAAAREVMAGGQVGGFAGQEPVR